MVNCIVCVKQVPFIEDTDYLEYSAEINRVKLLNNPFDLNALEEALRLKEKYDGNVTTISMDQL